MTCGTVCQLRKYTSGLLIGVVTIVIVAWVAQILTIWKRKRHRLVQLAAKLPGPKPLPIIGNALQFACKPEELLERTIRAIIPYQDVTPMRFWMGPLLHVVITEPRDIQVIFNSQKSTCKGSTYRLLLPFIGDGLISGSGSAWRSHRKLISPILNIRTLEGYMDSIQRHSHVFIEKLKPLANGSEFDVMPYLSRCTIDCICETVMGCRDMNSQEYPDQEFVHSTDRMYEIVHNRMMKVWLHPDCIFRLSQSYQDQQKCQRVIRDFTEKLIAVKKSELTAASNCKEADNYKDRNSILEQLLQQAQQMDEPALSDDELRDEIYTIYIASQDTMALIGSFTLLMLGIHQDIQEKVRSEIMQALTTSTKNVITSSLSDLKYLEMVIKETLRLFPVGPLLVRKIRSELALDTCVLPEGCEVVVAAYLTHRSSRHWRYPEKFLPERFLPEEIASRHAYSYIPFSGGLMGCIGQKFAMMSLKTIVANVVTNYRIHSAMHLEDIKLKSDISIRCINGYKLSLKPL